MDPGLDQAASLAPGRGWLAAEIRASDDQPVAAVLEGGVKIDQDWAAYGDVWVRPTQGEYGGDLGARLRDSLNLYVGGQANTHGDWQLGGGLRWNF